MSNIVAPPKKRRLTLLRDQKGAGFSEYLVLLVIIVVAGIAVWRGFRDKVEGKVGDVNTEIQNMK